MLSELSGLLFIIIRKILSINLADILHFGIFPKGHPYPMDPNTVWEGTPAPKSYPEHFLRRYLDP